MGKYTSLARTLRDEPPGPSEGEKKKDIVRNTYVNINNNDDKESGNPPEAARRGGTTLRHTTLTTFIEGEKDEKRSVPCIHGTTQDACAVCSGYARWLIEDASRIWEAKRNPEAMRRRYRETAGGAS